MPCAEIMWRICPSRGWEQGVGWAGTAVQWDKMPLEFFFCKNISGHREGWVNNMGGFVN